MVVAVWMSETIQSQDDPILDRFIPESARWLLTKGRHQEAKDLLQRASLENGVEMPDEMLDTLLNNNSEDSKPDMKKPSLFDLFRYPNLRRKSMLLFFNWWTIALFFLLTCCSCDSWQNFALSLHFFAGSSTAACTTDCPGTRPISAVTTTLIL